MGTSLCATAMTFTSGGAMGGPAALPPQPARRETTETTPTIRGVEAPAECVEGELRRCCRWREGGPAGAVKSSDMNTPWTTSEGTPINHWDGWHRASSNA